MFGKMLTSVAWGDSGRASLAVRLDSIIELLGSLALVCFCDISDIMSSFSAKKCLVQPVSAMLSIGDRLCVVL